MTELELLIDLHENNERQGPGSETETLKALSLMAISKYDQLKIADIGCGSGAQTLTLAQNTAAEITAVDLFPEFLDKLNMKAKKLGVEKRIQTLQESMDKLPFAHESFDIIWSEGAVYNMGFENGIQYWRNFLKPGGYLAVSEISWTTYKRPKELTSFWIEAYPEIDTVAGKMTAIELAGYQPVAYFLLPDYCWMDHYYNPLQNRFDAFLKKYNHSEAAKAIVEAELKEIDIYSRYKNYYSYGFYIARKP